MFSNTFFQILKVPKHFLFQNPQSSQTPLSLLFQNSPNLSNTSPLSKALKHFPSFFKCSLQCSLSCNLFFL
ncbi:hypothetical protein ACE6H2_020339 [Prunus campanulata]